MMTKIQLFEKSLREGTWALESKELPNVIETLESFKRDRYSVIGDDIFFDRIDEAIKRAKELLRDYPNTSERGRGKTILPDDGPSAKNFGVLDGYDYEEFED
jgi:hypothetical protein